MKLTTIFDGELRLCPFCRGTSRIMSLPSGDDTGPSVVEKADWRDSGDVFVECQCGLTSRLFADGYEAAAWWNGELIGK